VGQNPKQEKPYTRRKLELRFTEKPDWGLLEGVAASENAEKVGLGEKITEERSKAGERDQTTTWGQDVV